MLKVCKTPGPTACSKTLDTKTLAVFEKLQKGEKKPEITILLETIQKIQQLRMK